ncbi:MAG: PSD1 and planctomycete cytochrome C domain-containing protein [Gemmataceae bacterium]
MRTVLSIVSVCILCTASSFPVCAADPPIQFQRDVRPILSNFCYKCHGPGTKKGGVRLDSLEHARKKDAIVPGEPANSYVIDRITSNDADDRMPPPDSGPALTEKQIAILRQWIKEGAVYSPHWAFAAPRAVEPVTPANGPGKTEQPIDGFVRRQLKVVGLTPSERADKRTQIRRVTLDLVGFLPTPAEVDAFVKDNSADAYERLVDRLLASPHYGERQARHWLDLARYADSNGYTFDGPRSIWPYRDWVIKAYNDDMPFDQFTIEQLAGDLLPNPSKEQLTATGFHRNTAFNEEGGADPEQFRVERVVDRTNTTGAVWLGLTIGCAQCHDHKYDPVTQKDYYRLLAFFNSCDEPHISVGGTPELEEKINDMQHVVDKLKSDGMLEEAKVKEAEIRKLAGRIPTTLILRERKTPRESFVFLRGDFLRHGDKVEPGYPTAFSYDTGKKKLTRLDLARWLVSPDNPLTARVVVNRAWQQLFGKGLVETENDFGIQGSLPSHPALLDWLAVEFRTNGWSTKKLLRTIVLSETYRQSSVVRPDLEKTDPNNKWLARQSRTRLEAEIIRDAALSASGLLTRKIGGPGVYPPMPSEVFTFTQARKSWVESKGEDRYRRGMYTFLWRQSQHHLLTTFDGADAQTACTRRNRSNTPLQALHLANDPAFVEFFAALGQRMEKDGPADDAGKIQYGFSLCFCRAPSDREKARMLEYVDLLRKQDPKKIWTNVARVLINLDEFVTRE